jgi:hypothetical protein
MTPRLWTVAALCLGAAACATTDAWHSSPTPPTVYPPAAFTHRVSTSDVTVYWNCTRPEPDALRVDGVVQNISGGVVQYAEVELVSVDARDRTIASLRSAVRDPMLQTNQTSPFLLGLRTVGAEARIDLYYEYRVRSLFGPGGFQVSPQRFRARDICSESQHRIPKPQ